MELPIGKEKKLKEKAPPQDRAKERVQQEKRARGLPESPSTDDQAFDPTPTPKKP